MSIVLPFGKSRGPGSQEFEKAQRKVKELTTDAYCVYSELRRRHERCQVLIDMDWDLGDGVKRRSTALVASGPTWPDALEMFWNWFQTPADQREALFREACLREVGG